MLNKAKIYIIQWPTKEVTNSFMFILYLKRKKTTLHFGFLSFMVFSILQCLKVNLTSALNEWILFLLLVYYKSKQWILFSSTQSTTRMGSDLDTGTVWVVALTTLGTHNQLPLLPPTKASTALTHILWVKKNIQSMNITSTTISFKSYWMFHFLIKVIWT